MIKAKNEKKTGSLLEKIDTAYPGFADSVNSMDVQGLKNFVAGLASNLQEEENEYSADEKVQAAKDEVKALSENIKQLRKETKLKTKFVVSLLKEKGAQ